MLIVGIAGGTGSGKTTVVKKLMNVFPDNQVIVMADCGIYLISRFLLTLMRMTAWGG